ncbi:hypothetical protein EDB84DRAFT_1565886 [Lactarius hengduanensis]|nr:hypothetical protein EDB84DRAFT_1565886 [Lactarius hengduanensis]
MAYPESYFQKLITVINANTRRVPYASQAQVGTPATMPTMALTNDQRAQVIAEARELLFNEAREALRVNDTEMTALKEQVNQEMRALNNADDWRDLYKHELIEATHEAFERQYPGLWPQGNGKGRAVPPLTTSQVVRDVQPRIKAEVAAIVDQRIRNIHQEVKESLEANDPFWTEGPLCRAIANDIKAATLTTLEAKGVQETAQFKAEFRIRLIQDIQDYKDGVREDIKVWKVKYHNACDLSALHLEARRLGYSLTPTDEAALQREADAFKRYVLEPLLVGAKYNFLLDFLSDLNVPNSPLPPSSPPQPSSPMEEDTVLAPEEATNSAAANNNGGLTASIHAPSCASTPVMATPTPIPAYNPNTLSQVAVLDLQSAQPTVTPLPAPLSSEPAWLAALPPVPSSAASEDGLTTLLSALQATIARLDSRLNAQDRRIEEIAKPRDPRTCNAKGNSAKATEAVAAPPAPNTTGPTALTAMDETLCPPAHVDDPAEEAIAELLSPGMRNPPCRPPSPW